MVEAREWPPLRRNQDLVALEMCDEVTNCSGGLKKGRALHGSGRHHAQQPPGRGEEPPAVVEAELQAIDPQERWSRQLATPCPLVDPEHPPGIRRPSVRQPGPIDR